MREAARAARNPPAEKGVYPRKSPRAPRPFSVVPPRRTGRLSFSRPEFETITMTWRGEALGIPVGKNSSGSKTLGRRERALYIFAARRRSRKSIVGAFKKNELANRQVVEGTGHFDAIFQWRSHRFVDKNLSIKEAADSFLSTDCQLDRKSVKLCPTRYLSLHTKTLRFFSRLLRLILTFTDEQTPFA